MAQPVRHRIGLHARREFVHEAFVRESVLQPRGRAQRPREERRTALCVSDALGPDRAGALRSAADLAR